MIFLIFALLPFANGSPFSKQSRFRHCSTSTALTSDNLCDRQRGNSHASPRPRRGHVREVQARADEAVNRELWGFPITAATSRSRSRIFSAVAPRQSERRHRLQGLSRANPSELVLRGGT